MASLALEGSDLVIEHGRLQLVTGQEEISQTVGTRIKMIRGEFFADLTQGVPYVGKILVKNPPLSIVRNIFIECVAETPGVASVRNMELTFDRGSGLLTVEGDYVGLDGVTATFAPVQIEVA